MRRPGSLVRRTPALTAVALLLAAPVSGQEWHDFRSARQVGDVSSLSVQLVYGAGHLNLDGSELPLLYDARLRYDVTRFAPVRSWSRDGSRASVRIGLESVADPDREDGRTRLRLGEDVDLDLDDLMGSGDKLGTLDVSLNPMIETALDIKVGAAEADLELGGLSLRSIDFATGASDAEISFDEPNRIPMDHLSFKSGAAAFEARGLGNARFETFEFEGAVGEVQLDFSGEWDRSATAKIKVVIGELRIRVPREIGVRVTRKSLLSSLEADGFEKRGDGYVSPNWDGARIRFDIELEAGFGTVEILRR